MSRDLQTTVISACAKHERLTAWNADYRPCVCIGMDYFVKYGYRYYLEPELATQEYIFAHAQLAQEDPVFSLSLKGGGKY